MTIAVVALGWYAGVRLGAALDHRADEHAFEQYVASTPEIDRRPQVRSRGASDVRTAASRSVTSPLRQTGVVGRIEIPRLGLSAIVREGADARTLRRAVGHIPDTTFPGGTGNAALAGHRDTFFRPLKNVRQGDHIRVTTADGTFTYVVRETRIVAPTDVSVLDPTPEQTLTLITCYPFNYIGTAPKRFIVRAVGTQNSELRTQKAEGGRQRDNLLSSEFIILRSAF